ncbi:hypothetical protein ACIBSW_11750 [Actinoplanes sp. NPDC049668]
MKVATATTYMTITSATPPSVPRLRLEPTGSPRALLDGAWWGDR